MPAGDQSRGGLPPVFGPADLTPVFGPGSRMVQLGCGECFELGGGEHIQGGVASARVVEILDVVGDSHAELFHGAPRAGVEQFCLHPPPERLDHCIVIAISNGSHAQL